MGDPPKQGAAVQQKGAIIVFAVGRDLTHPKVREVFERCQQHGVTPEVLDAAEDPWFKGHLDDPRTLAHFPLLCVRGALVGGVEVVRRLDATHQLGPLLKPESSAAIPRIALSRSAAEELSRALQGSDKRVRLGISPEFEHDLALDDPRPGDLELVVGEVPLLLDPDSATRANGVAIDWIDEASAQGFRIDNPNRPEPVHLVDFAWLGAYGLSGLVIIDVRTEDEYTVRHLDRARHLDATLMDELEALDRGTPLLFYCNGGVRSKKAAEHYRELGFTEVYCLTEDLSALTDSNVP